jgi:hypothetical protein
MLILFAMRPNLQAPSIMNTFLKLNFRKLRFALFFSAATMSSLVSLVLLIAYFKTGHSASFALVISILVFTVFLFPVFIVLLGYFSWLFKRSRKLKLFSKPPFNDLEKIGFYNSLKGENSRWVFTEEIKEGEIKGVKIKCDLAEQKLNTVEFELFNVFREIDKRDFKRLEELFREYNGYFKFDTIAISYTAGQAKNMTPEDLKSDLEKFIMMLKREGFEVNRQSCSV